MSRISSFIVLAIYVLYFVHELKTRRVPDEEEDTPEMREVGASSSRERTIRFADERPSTPKSVEEFEMQETSGTTGSAAPKSDAQHTAHEQNRRSLDSSVAAGSGSQGHDALYRTRSGSGSLRFGHRRTGSRDSVAGSDGRRTYTRSPEDLGPEGRRVLMRSALPTRHVLEAEHLQPRHDAGVTRFVSVLVLIVTSALMSMSAEFLVSTIDEVTHRGQLSESVIGLIILPIVGNMAEYITVVTVAVKEKLDLAIAVSVGSSIQIALCVTPLTVLAAWILDRDLVLTFSFFEMATLVGTVLLVNLIILSEGAAGPRSSALKGGLICGCYAIIGCVLFSS